MTTNERTLGTIAAVLAALAAGFASAQVHPEKPTYAYEKCYGIARQGLNDCFFSANSCAGTAERDQEPGAWIYLPKGTCERIVGGLLQPPKAE
jgi:uncharacterized membrane protein